MGITTGARFKVSGFGWATVLRTCATSGLVFLEFTHGSDDTPYPVTFRRSMPAHQLY